MAKRKRIPHHDPTEDLAAAGSQRFDLAVHRLADALEPGLDPSHFVGSGIDYVQSRPWADGDDVRSIDHRVSARNDRVYVKEYESLRGTPIVVAIDPSRSMHLGLVTPGKYRVACACAAGIGMAGLRRGSAVGIETLGGKTLDGQTNSVRLPATRERGRLMGVLRQLPRLRASALEAGEGLGAALRSLSTRMHQRHLVFVISDLHGSETLAGLRRLHMQHDLVVIRPVDPAERQIIKGGLIVSEEAETGRGGLRQGLPGVDVDGPLASLRSSGIDALALPLGSEWVPELVHFLRMRGTAKKAAR